MEIIENKGSKEGPINIHEIGIILVQRDAVQIVRNWLIINEAFPIGTQRTVRNEWKGLWVRHSVVSTSSVCHAED